MKNTIQNLIGEMENRHVDLEIVTDDIYNLSRNIAEIRDDTNRFDNIDPVLIENAINVAEEASEHAARARDELESAIRQMKELLKTAEQILK